MASSDSDISLPLAYSEGRRRYFSTSSEDTYSDEQAKSLRRERKRKWVKKRKNEEKEDKPMWKKKTEDNGKDKKEELSSSESSNGTYTSSTSSDESSSSPDRKKQRRSRENERKEWREEEGGRRGERSIMDGTPTITCDECGSKHFTPKALMHHKMNYHGRNIKCHICPLTFDTNNSYRDHCENIHPNEPVKCTFCKSVYERPLEMRDRRWDFIFSHLYGEILYSRIAAFEESNGTCQSI